MSRVRAHPRQRRSGRYEWVTEYDRPPMTVRLRHPGETAVPGSAAYVDVTKPEEIVLNDTPVSVRAHPESAHESYLSTLGHETLHAALARNDIDVDTNYGLDRLALRARDDYLNKHPEHDYAPLHSFRERGGLHRRKQDIL